MGFQPGATLYTQGFGVRPENVEVPHIDTRDPTSNDANFPIGKRWINVSKNAEFSLTSLSSYQGTVTATWEQASGGTSTYPITPYVVGPVGLAGYQTIQSALDAANAAGGGIVYVQPGSYTESLTLYGNTQVSAVSGNSDSGTAGNTVVITGVHTPPTSGSFTFASVRLNSATDIFNSSAAGTASLVLINVFINTTSGFIFNLPNWTGTFVTYNVGDGSTNNGVVNNTSGAVCFFISATHGAGTGKTMVTSGTVVMQEIDFDCPWIASTGSAIACDYVIFTQPPSLNNNSMGAFNWCRFSTGANSAVTMNSNANFSFVSCFFDSTNPTTIAGNGTGTIKMTQSAFSSNPVFSGLLTQSWGTTVTGPIFAEGDSVIGGNLSAQALTATNDIGGRAATTSISNISNTSVSTGTGTIKMTTANSASSSAWIKIYIGTTPYYIPCFSTDAP